jgi:hypothetical protein
MAEQAPYVVNAVLTAGARNELYNAHRNEWIDYAGRKRSLRRVASLANQLASELCALDILSHTKLVSPADPRQLSALVGSLEFLRIGKVTALEIQDNGRPRDLAEEGWILEMADIYENAFCRPPSVSGSGSDPVKRRGKFYRFLERGLPASFFRHGKLSVRQIKRVLTQRKKRTPVALMLDAATSNSVNQNAATDCRPDTSPVLCNVPVTAPSG